MFEKIIDEDFNNMIKEMNKDFNNMFKIKNVRVMSHTIHICVPNDLAKIEQIFAKVGSLGVRISPAASNNSLFAESNTATTVMAIIVENFNPELTCSQITDHIVKVIDGFDYYGIIVRKSDGSSSWRAGNVKKLEKQTFPEVKTEIKQAQSPEIKPEPTNPYDRVFDDLEQKELLLKVVEKSCEISDIFFDGISRDDRVSLSRKLKEMLLPRKE